MCQSSATLAGKLHKRRGSTLSRQSQVKVQAIGTGGGGEYAYSLVSCNLILYVRQHVRRLVAESDDKKTLTREEEPQE